jgi:arsenite methyltransferase
MQEYLDVIAETGFKNIRLHKQRKLEIPEEIVRLYLNDEEKVDFMNGSAGLFSITVSGYKQ